MERDKAALQAGLTLAINNGQVERQVTRFKLIKRTMYGKAGFALLNASKMIMRILRERQRSIVILVRSKRTPDMPKDLCRSPSERLKMLRQILEQ